MISILQHTGIFLMSLLTFGMLRGFSYKFHPEDPKWAKLIWQLPCHVVCTMVGWQYYVDNVKDHFDVILVPDNECLSEAYAFFFGYWTTVVIDFYRDTFSRDRDKNMMLLHHCATFLAMASSDVFGFRRIGVYILLLHDFSDIFIMTLKISFSRHIDMIYMTSVYLVTLMAWVFTRIILFGELYVYHVLPAFHEKVIVGEKNVLYILPVIALTILLSCNLLWTKMLLGYAMKTTHEVVHDYRQD